MIAYSIEAGLKSKYVDKVVVSSDNKEILDISKKSGADTIKRPDKLANDTATTVDVLVHAIKNIDKSKLPKEFQNIDFDLWEETVKLQETFNLPAIATMSMRDRNKIALQGDLLGANDLDVVNILALTGDPAKMSDQPNTKAVLEGNSTLLLQMIRNFNNGID